MKKIYAGLFLLLAILVIVVVAIKTLELQEVNYENNFDDTKSSKEVARVTDLPEVDKVNRDVNYDYLFTSSTSTTYEYSNIVGTLAYESFAWYVPDWLVENWDMNNSASERGDLTIFTPKGNVDSKLISSISFYIEPSTESFNAATMYENESGDILIKEIILSQHKEGALQILIEPETRIYHVQSQSVNNIISDVYMMDGNGYTLRIHFMADKDLFQRYANKIRDMVGGIGEVKGPRG